VGALMPRLEVTVEVDRDAPDNHDSLHVTGTVRSEDGSETAFVGWVGLLALVERALTAEAR